MKMYKCGDCGHEFFTPKYVTETVIHTEVDNRREETLIYETCPECGADYLLEGQQCLQGHDRFTEGEFCEECLTKFGDAIEVYARKHGMDYETGKKLVGEWIERYW